MLAYIMLMKDIKNVGIYSQQGFYRSYGWNNSGEWNYHSYRDGISSTSKWKGCKWSRNSLKQLWNNSN